MAAVEETEARKRPALGEACPGKPGKKKKRARARLRYQFEDIYEYEMLEEIAESPFAVVAKARDLRTGETVAVKWIRGGRGEGGGAPKLREVVMLEAGCLAAGLGLPGIVQIKNVSTDETSGDMYIVMELVAGHSLRSRFTQTTPPQPPFSEDETRDAMRQLLQAVEKLHATGTAHRNINLDNVIVGPGGELKICGFGSATPGRRVGKVYLDDKPEDMLGLGCVMAELLTGEPLFTATTEDDLLEQRLELQDDLFAPMGADVFEDMMDLSLAGRELLAGLLTFFPSDRLTVAAALKHRWFTDDEAKSPAAAE